MLPSARDDDCECESGLRDCAEANQGKTQPVDYKPALLLVSADVRVARLCQQLATQLDCELAIESEKSSAEAALCQQQFGVALIDADTAPQYLHLTRQLKERSARTQVVISQSAATISAAVDAIKAGASDYLEKPLNTGSLEQSISRALRAYAAFQPPVVPLEQVIRGAITSAVMHAQGDKVRAAHLLAIGKTTLYRKLREYGECTERKTRRPAKERKAV